jgi:thiamine-phosphate pyrophosphorylase
VSAENDLRACLRLVVLTHPSPTAGSLLDVVAECLEAGCRAIQLRDKTATTDRLYAQATALEELTSGHGALLFINDRFDVALAAGASGVHLGPEDLPVDVVRRCVGPDLLIGYSTDDPDAGDQAALDGADYLGVGAVYGTTSKAGLELEAVGPERVGAVLRAAGVPGVGIGGIHAGNAGPVAAQGAGVAVLGAVMHSLRPGEAVEELLGVIARAEDDASARKTTEA